MVVEVISDCQVASYTPVFFDLVEEEERQIPYKRCDVDTSINRKDIPFIDTALKYNADFISVNEVTTKEMMKEARNLIRKKPNVKLLAKIQSPHALANIDGIIDVSDGIVISRNYLANFVPHTYNYYVQRDIISKCKRMGKPVFIVGHIFESMQKTSMPNCSEINDVVGLINDGIDGLILVKETMYSMYSHNCVEMLSKVILGSEETQMGRGFGYGNTQMPNQMPFDDRADRDREKEFIKVT